MTTCKYALFHNPPQAPGGGKYMHPKAVDNGKIDLEGLLKEMEKHSRVSRAQLTATVADLLSLVEEKLAEGKSVYLNGLGEFRMSLKCPPGITDPSQVRANSIHVKSVGYKPDTALKKRLEQETQFVRTLPLKLSAPLTEDEALAIVRKYFDDPANEGVALTSRIFSGLAMVNKSKASNLLRQFVMTGHLVNPSKDVHHPIYLPGPKL